MVIIDDAKILAIGKVLNDPNRPLKERFRALFTLRNIGGPLSIECINSSFVDSSALLKHELAYCLGQMQDKRAIPHLVKVLEDCKQEAMVRHEAAEALGAIGFSDSIAILQKYSNDDVVEVAETCQLALKRIEWAQNGLDETAASSNPYKSIDPAPPAVSTKVDDLKTVLLDDNASLFDRYKAMFALRNLRSKEAVMALSAGLKGSSALFRHEIAFVLGQLQDEASVVYLKESLENGDENEMVRHECAEALGAIASKDCYDALKKYINDEKRVVRESCEIALDMCDYENSPEFQYANLLQNT